MSVNTLHGGKAGMFDVELEAISKGLPWWSSQMKSEQFFLKINENIKGMKLEKINNGKCTNIKDI